MFLQGQCLLYDKDSRIVGVTDRNGVRTSYVLDGNGNIIESVDGEGHSSFFEYDSMDRLTKVKLRRIDKVHKVDEIQETLYTYDHRGLVKTEVNAAGDGKALIYDGNGNLIQKTDEDGYVTEYKYSPVNLVTKASYADGKEATYLYDGTGDLIRMVDWVGETTFEYDLLDRLLNVNDHNDRNVNYVYDNVGNTIAIQYPDGTQADYWYDAENQMVELADLDGGLSRFEFDPNGNVIYKEYPNNETAVYSYDAWNQLIELDEYDLGGKKHFKTTYTWDAEGNRLSEMQYNHGQTAKPASDLPDTSSESGTREMVDALLAAALPNQEDLFSIFTQPDSAADGVFSLPGIAQFNNSSTTPGNGGENTGKDDATIPGNGDGNGQVPPGQTEDEEGGIQNPAGHYPPGLNRGKKPDKPENPDKPGKPENPGTEDKSDRKAQKGEHSYEYNKNGWVVQGTVAKETTTYTYNTLGNLVQEKCKNTVVDYQYNILNQLVSRSDKNDSVTFTYDKRGNRVAEAGKKATEAYVYDATNHLVEGTNWQGDKSAYQYNGLFVRVRNTQTTHSGQVYDREFVIDYNSFERNDLMVFSAGYYEQKHIYTAWGERMEQFTERGNWDRLLYVHEDIMGNTRYYTKDNGQSFAELEYDVWGAITSPSKLTNNDNGNFAAAVFTGHPYDTVLDIYFAEARFYDAKHRQWMASDPIKSGLNWYLYVEGNPATYWDPDGLAIETLFDVVSVVWSAADFVKAPTWPNAGWLTLDVVSAAIPFLPASKTVKAGKKTLDMADDTLDTIKAIERVISETPNAKYLGPALSAVKTFDKKRDFVNFIKIYSRYADDIYKAGLKAEDITEILKTLEKSGLIKSSAGMKKYFAKLACASDAHKLLDFTGEFNRLLKEARNASKAIKGAVGEKIVQLVKELDGYVTLPSKILGDQGIDHIFVKYASDGKILSVIFDETKYRVYPQWMEALTNPLGLLSDTRAAGKQLSKGWIEWNLKRMAGSSDPAIAKAGKEILELVKDGFSNIYSTVSLVRNDGTIATLTTRGFFTLK